MKHEELRDIFYLFNRCHKNRFDQEWFSTPSEWIESVIDLIYQRSCPFPMDRRVYKESYIVEVEDWNIKRWKT